MNGSTPVFRGQLRLLFRVWLMQTWRRLAAVTRQSRLLMLMIVGFVGGYNVLAFWLFYKGLRFANTFPGLGTLLTERLMFLMFAFLTLLLLISNLVIGYTNLFKNRETQFLLTLPVATQTIYRWKFLESTLLASWAFLFLIAPLLAAYGLVRGVEWHFYLTSFGLLCLFVILPALLGSFGAVVLARYLDRKTFQVLMLFLLGAVFIVAPFLMQPEHFTDTELETRVMSILDRMLKNTGFVQFPLLPSYWLSAGVINWADGARSVSFFYTLVLFSNVLFFGLLAFTRMGNPFYEAASAVNSRGSVLGRWKWLQQWQSRTTDFAYSISPAERIMQWIPGLKSDERALLVKDARMFWRDTAQWAQTLMLFGLLGVYILNLRHFTQQATNEFWVFMVSFLNLGACSLNLATLTTRFVFPQFSLEGKRIWVIGMAPMGLRRVILVKFWLAFVVSLLITLTLTWLSCHMLKLPLERTLFFMAAVVLMTFTLNAMAIGLGALYPNFREDNPGKIVSGFGGTFCLVMSFLYIVASVTLLAVGSPWRASGAMVPLPVMVIGMGMFGFISLLLGVVPFYLALRHLRNLEI